MNENKAKRIAELEAELAELKKPVFSLLRIFGKRKTVLSTTTTLSETQSFVTFTDNPKARRRNYISRTNDIPVIGYTED